MKRTFKTPDLNTTFIVGCFFSVFLSFITLLLHITKSGIGFVDHEWIWKECACTLKGVDSAVAIQKGLVFPDIGNMPPATATFPWTRILGIIVHGSFLPYHISCIYYVVLNVIVMMAALIVIYNVLNKELNYYNKEQKNNMFAFIGVILFFSSWYLTDWLTSNNNGTLVCFLVICVIGLNEEHEVLAGILTGIAMIKPQIVLPFCLIWLIKKRWKLLAAAIAIDTGAWLASIMITGVSPMMQMRSLFAMRVSMQDNYLVYGILDVLRQFGVKTSYVLFGSMLIGTIVCATTSFFISRSQIFQNNLFLSYLTPAVVSVFWSYKSQCDYNILIIAAVGLVEYWCSGHQSWRKLFLIAWMEILLLMKPFSLLSALSSVLLGTNRLGNVYLINRVDLYAKVVIYIIFVIVVLRQRRIATV